MKHDQIPSSKSLPKGFLIEYLKDEVTHLHFLEITFPTGDGGTDKFRVGAAERTEPAKIAKQLSSRGAALPEDRKERLLFVEGVVAAAPRIPVVLTTKPGFRGPDGFVMPNRSYGSAERAFRWGQEPDSAEPRLGDVRGTLKDWNATVGQLALESPYVSFGIMMALGACLPAYVMERGGGQLVAESAVINMTSETTTGKTSIARTAAGVAGNPNALLDWDITARGTVEALAAHNNLAVVFDDTEKFPGDEAALGKAVHILTQKVAGARSRTISSKAHDGLPPLTWSTFAISTSTKPLFVLLGLTAKPESGDRPRAIDVPMPLRRKGGIFGSKVRGKLGQKLDSAVLIRQLEAAVQANYGVLFPRFIKHLLANDLVPRVQELVTDFARDATSPDDHVAYRTAVKLGLGYAAAVIAIEAGLLEWPTNWPHRAARHCCLRAFKLVQADTVTIRGAVRYLKDKARDRELFVFRRLDDKASFAIPFDAIGIRCRYKDRPAIGVRHDCLGSVIKAELRKPFVAHLEREGLLVKGHGGTPTVQITRPMEGGVKVVAKPRFYLIDLAKLEELA